MAPPQPVRALIADDHAVFAEALALALASDRTIDVVATASDGAEAVDRAREHQPDVVVMDVHMPVMNGLDAARLLHTVSPRTRIVILTSDDSAQTCAAAFAAGASAFVAKGCGTRELLDAVREAAAGGSAQERGAA